MSKRIKCISDQNLIGVTIGQIYFVDAEDGLYYYLTGLFGGKLIQRFALLEDDRIIRLECINDTFSNGALYKGRVYTQAGFRDHKDPESDYILTGIASSWSQRRFRKIDDRGSVIAHPIVSKTVLTVPLVDDKARELAFFKTRRHNNECPCGSTRGICPDHS